MHRKKNTKPQSAPVPLVQDHLPRKSTWGSPGSLAGDTTHSHHNRHYACQQQAQRDTQHAHLLRLTQPPHLHAAKSDRLRPLAVLPGSHAWKISFECGGFSKLLSFNLDLPCLQSLLAVACHNLVDIELSVASGRLLLVFQPAASLHGRTSLNTSQCCWLREANECWGADLAGQGREQLVDEKQPHRAPHGQQPLLCKLRPLCDLE